MGALEILLQSFLILNPVSLDQSNEDPIIEELNPDQNSDSSGHDLHYCIQGEDSVLSHDSDASSQDRVGTSSQLIDVRSTECSGQYPNLRCPITSSVQTIICDTIFRVRMATQEPLQHVYLVDRSSSTELPGIRSFYSGNLEQTIAYVSASAVDTKCDSRILVFQFPTKSYFILLAESAHQACLGVHTGNSVTARTTSDGQAIILGLGDQSGIKENSLASSSAEGPSLGAAGGCQMRHQPATATWGGLIILLALLMALNRLRRRA